MTYFWSHTFTHSLSFRSFVITSKQDSPRQISAQPELKLVTYQKLRVWNWLVFAHKQFNPIQCVQKSWCQHNSDNLHFQIVSLIHLFYQRTSCLIPFLFRFFLNSLGIMHTNRCLELRTWWTYTRSTRSQSMQWKQNKLENPFNMYVYLINTIYIFTQPQKLFVCWTHSLRTAYKTQFTHTHTHIRWIKWNHH